MYSESISRRKFLYLAGLTGISTTLAACTVAPPAAPSTGPAEGQAESAPAAEVNTVVHWSWLSASDASVWNEHVIGAFNAAHDNLQIELLEVPSDQFGPKVLAAAASGSAPDFGNSTGGTRASFVADGVQVPLSQHLADAGLDWSDFIEVALADCRYPRADDPDELYHMPVDAMSFQMLVNADHAEEAALDLDAPPTTGEELVEWAKAMTVLDGDQVMRSGFLMTGSGIHVNFIFGLVAYQMGFRRANEELTEAGINPDAAKEAAQWVLDLFDTHRVSSRDVADRYLAFGTSESSMFITGPWTLSGYVEQGLNFRTVFTPNIGGELATSRSIGTLEMYLQADAARYATTAEVLKWISDNTFVWNTVGRGAAVRNEIAAMDGYIEAGHPWEIRGAFVEGLEFASISTPRLKNITDFQYYTGTTNNIHRHMDPVWLGEGDIDAAVDGMIQEWQELLDKENA